MLRDHANEMPRPKQSPPTVSIIVPSYNAREVLSGCLESIEASQPTASIEVIVIDDASTDGTHAMVRTRFPATVLLRNETNLGYAASCNRAMRLARGEFIYMLNNDTRMLRGAIDEMTKFLTEHPDAGAVGSRVLNEDGSIQWTVKALPSFSSAIFGARSILTRLFPTNRFSRRHLLHIGRDPRTPFSAGLVSGSSSMFPRNVVELVGELDERFFYHVDADYCKRVWDAGWKVYYLPSAAVVHLNHQGGSMSDWKQRFRSIWRFHWGSYLYYRKHILRSRWSLMQPLVITGLTARALLSLFLQVGAELARPLSDLARGSDSRTV